MADKRDVYALLSQSLNALVEPMNKVLKSHDEFTLQHVQSVQSIKTISDFKTKLDEQEKKGKAKTYRNNASNNND